ncbi:MAG: cytoskeleton protein RodZ [Glaciecola sp.]|jgi:cytoskeleton protein RodZ
MTEENKKTKESTTESTQTTPGQQLKKGREAKGLSQQQVADRLHLRLGNIQDIESDTHKPGVSITFTKGYVRIYAKLLNMPVEPLLAAFDILHQGDKQPAQLQSFSQRVAKQANDDRWMMVTYLIVFLVVASLVIWWYQQSDKSIMNRLNLFSDTTTEQQSNTNAISEGEAVNAIGNSQSMPDELAIPEEEIKQQDTLNDSSSDALQDSENISDSDMVSAQNSLTQAADNVGEELTTDAQSSNPFLGDTPLEAASTAIKDGYTVKSDGTVDVIFTFSEDCWLSVTDVNEDVLAVGVKVKGRVMSVNGVPPISVNMCPPDQVAINFAGAPVDLSSYPRGIPVKFALAVTGE